MLSIVFELRIGEDENEQPIYVEFPRERRFSFLEAAVERTFESLEYMGWTGDDPTEFAGGKGFNLGEKEVDVTLQYGRPYIDDKGRAWGEAPEIAWINPLNGIRGKKIAADDLKAWGASLAAERRKKRKAQQVAAKAVGANGTGANVKAPDFQTTDPDEQIPF